MNADKKSNWIYLRSSAFICGVIFLLCGCDKLNERRVVLYTSIDEPVARPIIADFEKATGIKVTLITDTEASKSVGLAERLRAEKDNPKADVWWGNEPFHTINLAEEGILEPYRSKATVAAEQELPSQFRNERGTYHCNGLRVRMIVSRGETIHSLDQLTDPELKGKIAMARPTAGTTGGHVAALYALWGDTKADAYFRALRANDIKLLGGNSVVVEAVTSGAATAGLTDNDDAASASDAVKAVLPDQRTIGTLGIPTTIGRVKGGANAVGAGQLIDYLVSQDVEKKLIAVEFSVASLRDDPPAVKLMDIDYEKVAKLMPQAVRRATAILEGRN